MPKKARVTLVNPAKKRRKKTATKGKKKMAKKKRKASPRRRRRRSTPRSNPAPRRRRRATSHNPRRRRRTRKNPTITKFGKIDVTRGLKSQAVGQLGALGAAWMVMKWGDPEQAPASQPFGAGAPYSQMMGAGWTFKNYVLALVGSWLSGEIGARIWGQAQGQAIYEGGRDLIMKKILWTQIISRTQVGPTLFGNMDRQYGMPTMPATQAMGNTEGDIYTDDQGNVWLMQGGRWVSMQGMDGLVETGPLGALVETGPLGDTGSGFLPSATPQGEADWAKYSQTGTTDPYHASYAQ